LAATVASVSLTVQRKSGRALRPLRKADLAEVGEALRAGIVDQARRGYGADGQRFKVRADGTPSTLTDTGALLAGVRLTEVSSDAAVVRPAVDYADDVQAARPFIGHSPQTIKAERAVLERAFRKNVALADVKNRRLAKAASSADQAEAEDGGGAD